MDLGVGIHRAGQQVAVFPVAEDDVLLGNHQHAARTAARVVNGANDPLAGNAVLVPGEHECDHQVNHVSRREVFARVLVQRLVEAPDQFFEDGAHVGTVNKIGMKVHFSELLQHLKEETRLVEFADRVVDVEPFQNLAHVLAEAGDVVPQIGGHVGDVRQQPLEVVARGVVERQAR